MSSIAPARALTRTRSRTGGVEAFVALGLRRIGSRNGAEAIIRRERRERFGEIFDALEARVGILVQAAHHDRDELRGQIRTQRAQRDRRHLIDREKKRAERIGFEW